jgi:hypothetical protein
MIDPDVDPDRAANARAEERAARRARRRAILAAGEPPQGRKVGHLAALPSVPPAANVGTLTETVAVTATAKDNAPAGNASAAFGGTTQMFAAAVLVAVLIVAWFVERRSAHKVEEVDHG